MKRREREVACAVVAGAVLLCLMRAYGAVQPEASRLQRYLGIADRQPFGEVLPPDEGTTNAPPAPTESFAKNLQMRAIIDDGITMRVGFLDMQQQKNIYLALGEVVDGLELVSVDYDNESAVLRKGQETSVFTLKPEGAAARETAAAAPTLAPPVPSTSASRRRPFFTNIARQAPGDVRTGGTTTPFRGKTIEEFLREHPDAALKYPSPLRPADPSALMQGKGETIEKFLRENPDAVRQFSPFKIVDPSAKVEGRGETIERFLSEHSGTPAAAPPQPVIQAPESAPFLFEEIPEDELYYE